MCELEKGDVLFIDEIHGLQTWLAECLYQPIDEKCLSIPVSVDSGVRLFKSLFQ